MDTDECDYLNMAHTVLKIGSQHFQGGLDYKCSLVDVVKVITSYDIFCVQEIWSDNIHSLKPPIGYQIYRSDRKHKNKKGRCCLFL